MTPWRVSPVTPFNPAAGTKDGSPKGSTLSPFAPPQPPPPLSARVVPVRGSAWSHPHPVACGSTTAPGFGLDQYRPRSATNTAPIERQAFVVRDTGKCFSRFRPPLRHCHLRPQLIEVVEDIRRVLPDKVQLRSSSHEDPLACGSPPRRESPFIPYHARGPSAPGARPSRGPSGRATSE